eukprot:m.103186 g.103186  ORF g.103186 m.103186 type:complete len:85 (+) comp14142_c1_seq1:1947-2201(+)
MAAAASFEEKCAMRASARQEISHPTRYDFYFILGGFYFCVLFFSFLRGCARWQDCDVCECVDLSVLCCCQHRRVLAAGCCYLCT